MRIRALTFALMLLALALGGHEALALMPQWPQLPWLAVLVPLLLLVFWIVGIMPGRRFRAWAYRVDPDELHLKHGVMVRAETIVPLGRVQHLDVSQGPLERAFGVCRLVLHTAGTAHSSVTLPGLTRERAEALRDEIRQQVRAELA
jgi:membrane protein YdbS with pleckstrin-like domain